MTPPAIDLFSTPDRIPNVVVVDPQFDSYGPLAESARDGLLDLHFRSRGRDALKLATRRTVDAWIVAPELDDMSGHDLVQLIRARLGETTTVAMAETAPEGGRQWRLTESEATAAGAEAVLSKPISLCDLQELLGLPSEELARKLPVADPARPFAMLPIGIGSAIVAIAVLMIG